MDANTSRVGLSVVNPEGVKVVVEFDFSNSASLDPRLRHAYGEYNNVRIGRYWSNCNSWVGNTANVDFDGVPGTAGAQDRTEQITYMSGPFSVSLENAIDYGGVVGVAPVLTLQPDGTQQLEPTPGQDRGTVASSPALTAKFENSQGGFSYAAAVMAKQTAYDTGSADDSAIGFAGFLAGKIAITDMISIQGAINYADGANAYVYRAGSNFAGADAATTTEQNTSMYINYMWSPVDKVSMGVQFENLETESQGGADGDANRLMYVAQYSF